GTGRARIRCPFGLARTVVGQGVLRFLAVVTFACSIVIISHAGKRGLTAMLLRPRSHTEIRSLLLPSLVLAAATLCNAATITYNVNQPIGAGGVTGDIVTDAKLGALINVDIVDWNLLLNDGSTTFDLTGPLSGGNSVLEPHWGAGDLTATA